MLTVTTITAGFLGLIYVYLSYAVVQQRMRSMVSLGDGTSGPARVGEPVDQNALQIAVRIHGNYVEYVPFTLILMGLIEYAGGNKVALIFGGTLVLLGRILHIIGMKRPAPNGFRAGGMMATWGVMILASLYALWLGYGMGS